jgi:hypothetical protein
MFECRVFTLTGCGSPFNGSRTVSKTGYDEYGVSWFEAAITKLIYLLGKGLKGKQLTKELQQNIAGELTVN